MKKLFAFVVTIVLLGFSLNAQNGDFKKQFQIGVGAGMLFSNVDFQPRIFQTQQRGLVGGVSVKYIAENHLGVVGEINYAQRGWKETFDDNADYSYDRTLNYVEMPFMTHIYFGRKVRFAINLGPQISYMMGSSENMSPALAQAIAEKEAATSNEDEKKRIGPQYKTIQKKLDYGLIGGIGMEFHTALGSFSLEGRYYFGLGDMFNTSIANKDPFTRAANRVIYGKLIYYIPFN